MSRESPAARPASYVAPRNKDNSRARFHPARTEAKVSRKVLEYLNPPPDSPEAGMVQWRLSSL